MNSEVQFDNSEHGEFRFTTRMELRDSPDPNWLVDQWLPEGSFACMYAPPETGKSFIAIDMGLCIQNGIPWHGRKVLGGQVILMTQEGQRSLNRRITAWETRHQLEPCCNSVLHGLEPLNLLRSNNCDKLLSKIEQIGEPRLIIFDTLSKYMVGANENESADMGKVIANLDMIRRKTQATILVIHHTVKNGSSLRGSSTLPAACDVMFKLCKRNKYHTLVVDKQRDAAPTSPIHFEMKEYGNSLVPVSTERQAIPNLSDGPWNMLIQIGDADNENGLTNKELRAVCKLSGRQITRNRNELVGKQLIVNVSTGRTQRWVLTKEGVAFLNATKDES